MSEYHNQNFITLFKGHKTTHVYAVLLFNG